MEIPSGLSSFPLSPHAFLLILPSSCLSYMYLLPSSCLSYSSSFPSFPLLPPPSSTSLLPLVSSPSYPAAYHSSLFASRSHLLEGEEVESYRVAQVLTILQNLSFEESSCEYLAGHEGVRK